MAAAPEGLTEAELRALSARARLQAVPRNTIVVAEGDKGNSVFIIESGRVKVFLRGEDGKEVVLNVQGPGEYFGDLALDFGRCQIRDRESAQGTEVDAPIGLHGLRTGELGPAPDLHAKHVGTADRIEITPRRGSGRGPQQRRNVWA